MFKIDSCDVFNDGSIGELEFLQTGVRQFDDLSGGIPRGGITIVSGATGNGKSMVLMHLAGNLARNNRILYISVENLPEVDKKRFNELPYGFEKGNFDYVGVQLQQISDYEGLANDIIQAISKLHYAAVFIDGGDILIEGADGASMYENGNSFMKEIISACGVNKTAVIISWQLGRAAIQKKIEDIDTCDVATSMGVSRYASCFYVVKRTRKEGENDWQVRLAKARFEYNWQPISVLDANGHFDLRGLNATFRCIKQQEI